MAALHTWLGLLFGWLLYFMVVTGTVGYLDTEIDRWMRPELPPAQYTQPAAAAAEHAVGYLQTHAADARRWTIQLPVDRNEPYLTVHWQPKDGSGDRAPGAAWLDATTGAPIAVRDTGAGQTLYQMHWRLHYLPQRIAEWVVAVASMALLLALCTGIVVHRRFFADFFTLRRGKGQRSWLDAHNVASVLTLPFQLMISYSGLIFLMFSFMPLIATAWYTPSPDAVRAFYGELFPPMAPAQATGHSAALTPIGPLLGHAQSHLGGAQIAMLDIQNPGDSNARISAIGNFAAGPVRSAGILVYDGASGTLLAERPAWQSAPRALRDLWLGLHEGLFAGPVLRAMYLLSGLMGCVMIATGTQLWVVKRRDRASKGRDAPARGLCWVERMHVAATLGLPVAIGAYFWANRLLPVGWSDRAQWEVHTMLAVWLATFVHAACVPARRAWPAQATVAALLFITLPLLNALTTQRGLVQSIASGDAVMAGMDLGALALGMALAVMAQRMRRRGSPGG